MGGSWEYGKSLHFPLSFILKLKLPEDKALSNYQLHLIFQYTLK